MRSDVAFAVEQRLQQNSCALLHRGLPGPRGAVAARGVEQAALIYSQGVKVRL